MLGTIITGCAIGGLTWSCKEMLSTFFKNENKNNEDELAISNDIWEDIWCSNKIYVQVDEENILTPLLLEIENINNGLKYIFKMPFGITTKDMNKCKIQIKELSNAIDIEIYHHKNDIAHIDIITKEEFNTIEGSINNTKWNNLWKELEIATGNHNDGYKYPSLIGEKEITGGTSYIFKMPIGKGTSNIIKHNITIKEFLHARSIEVEALKDNNVEIKAIYEELPTNVPYKFLKRVGKGFSIPLGKTIDGFAVIDFSKMANAIIAGNVGSGKSIMTKWILTYLGCMYSENELDIYLADLKLLEIFRFKNMKHVKKFVDNVDDLIKIIHELYDIMMERYKKFRDVDVSDIYEYNEKYPKDKMKYIVLVIEEFATYSEELNSRCTKNEKYHKEILFLKTFLSLARASGIMTIATIQRPTAENMHPDIKSYLGNKICFLSVNKISSAIMSDDEDLLCGLRGKGHGYLISQANTEKPIQEFQAFNISNNEIKEMLTKNGLFRDKEELEENTTEDNIAYKKPIEKKSSNTYNKYNSDSEFDDI